MSTGWQIAIMAVGAVAFIILFIWMLSGLSINWDIWHNRWPSLHPQPNNGRRNFFICLLIVVVQLVLIMWFIANVIDATTTVTP